MGAGGDQVRVAGPLPLLENDATVSSPSEAVFLLSRAPTAMLYGSAAGRSRPRLALVAGGADDGDAEAPGALDGGCQRVVGVAGVRWRRAKVEDPDVQALVGPCAAAAQSTAATTADSVVLPSCVGDLEADQVGLGRDADEVGRVGVRAGCGVGVAGDQAGHERAVAVRVEVLQRRVARLRGEVRAVEDVVVQAVRPARRRSR